MVKNFLDFHDDISLLACLIERANILHQDIEEDYILPINNADKAHDVQKMLVCAGANSDRAKIKAELISDILAEAQTLANSLVYQTSRAREEHDTYTHTTRTPTEPAEGQ